MPTFLSRIGYYSAVVAGLIGAMFLGTALGSDDYAFFVLLVVGLASLTWVIMAGEGWWLPMFFAIGIGGFFTLPYKIYPHELALLLSGVAILPRIAFRPVGMKKNRGPLPRFFYAVFAYLLIHYLYSVVTNGGDFQSNGSITRAYLNALWPFFFGVAFFLYGTTRNLRAGLVLLYIALGIRLSFGLTNYLLDDTLIVPLLNYSIDPQDLRISGSMLMILSGFWLFLVRSPILKIFHSVVFLVASYGFLCGGSRGLLIGMIFFALFLCIALKRWLTMAALGLAFALLFATFNFFPGILDAMPYRVERGLSIMVFRADAQRDIHDDVRGSDEFHTTLRAEGLRRWTADPKNIAVGTGIKPFDVGSVLNVGRFEVDQFSLLTQMCADNGGYESALWSVLAVLGAVGFFLYAGLLLPWLRQLFLAVRSRKWRGEQFIIIAWACASIATWFVMMNFYGSYPSFEIFFAILSMAVIADRRIARLNDPTSPVAALPAPAFQPKHLVRRRDRVLTSR